MFVCTLYTVKLIITSVVWTPQINYVVCCLLAVMMFWLVKCTRREPKGCYLLVGWLVYTTANN